MALINRPIPNLFNGVSQQPASLRLSSQAEAQVNGYSTLVDGLIKRPPLYHIAKVRATAASTAFVHFINLNATDRFMCLLLDTDLEIYKLSDGSSVTCNFPDGKTYLDVTTPRTDFAVVTVADRTLIANKTKTVLMDSAVSGGTFKGTKQLFSGLPTTGNTDGDIWEIEGDSDNNFDSYYVKYASGIWVESMKDNETYKLDAATMPHELVYDSGTGQFTFQKATWTDRAIGDRATVPDPSFVGQTINDVFYHKNRFGILANEGVSMTRSGALFNYWPETNTAVLASDPIDVKGAHSKVSILEHAVPFRESLLLFSAQTQFSLDASSGALTQSSVTMNPTTEFESSVQCKPVGAGQNVFFAVEKAGYTGLREYFVDADTVSNDASDITAHVPKYVPGNVFKMVASSNEDILLALSLDEQNALYVYKYYWDSNEKVQSSWFKWELPSGDTILGMHMINSSLYLVVQRTDGIFLERMTVSANDTDTDMTFLVLLDRRTSLTGVYDGGSNTTTWTLPYLTTETISGVLSADFGANSEQSLTLTQSDNGTYSTVTASGDYSGGEAILGTNYEMRYTFSQQFMKDNADVAIAQGRLQMRTWTLIYTNSGYFRIEVTPKNRDTLTYYYANAGKTLGGGAVIGTTGINSGEHRFPVMAEASQVDISIVNDTYLPSQFQSAEWEAFYHARARRV